ncbi:unnamed protein product, partial [Mesorhabditis belari]|uniref:Uncharacterized protein n=1 Tax=Mesorhabditis belari TaxID=2138241 RepID=A0AAF3FLQ4_9BILA
MREAATITTSSLVDTSSVEIAAQKAPNLQKPPLVCSNLFRPLKDVAQECMTEMQRVIEFQQRHKNGLVRHFSYKDQKAVTFAKSVRCELEKQKGREQQFVKERTELQKRVEKLRKENEQLKNQMERMRQQPSPQTDYMSTAPDSGLGTNDSLSLSFIETVTSTPIIEQGPNTRRHLAAAFQISSGAVSSPICSVNRLLTTPAMLGLSKTPHTFHTQELIAPRSAAPYEKIGLSGGMRIVEERRVLTDRRPKSKKQNGSRGQDSDDYMDGIG